MIFEQREITMDRARRIAAILAVLLASATPASARIVGAWQCGEIDVELHKYATKLHELRFSGTLTVASPTGKPTTGVNFKYVGRDGAILNGKSCRVLPYDPKWDEND
jgi:hypothetical protein